MFDAGRVKQDFSAAAPQYDAQTALQKHVLSQLAAKMLPQLPPQARVLDAGCGTGRFTRRTPACHVTQLDFALAMCRKAVTPEAPAINGTIESLPFADGLFDGVFCSLVLQWVADAKPVLKELQRVLRRGGVMATSAFGPGTLKELKESFAIADRYPHVTSFKAPAVYEKREVITEYYPDLFALMAHLKTIGARNKLLERRKSLMTRGQMARVEQCYRERFAAPEGLPVTWEIFYSIVRKS